MNGATIPTSEILGKCMNKGSQEGCHLHWLAHCCGITLLEFE
jgi:hypothetical protein